MPSIALATLLLALCASVTRGQLTDLQPGPNFPTATPMFGLEHSENVDVGDLDNDGDLDVVVANGGDCCPQPNRIFINQAGLQAGIHGDLIEDTAVRFAGLPLDTSRDVEFLDADDDGDLDLFFANRGTLSNGGEVSRLYLNGGGMQASTVGHFTEGTDAFWGTLVSVPPGDEEGLVDGQGPWRGYSCDCDFADVDDDGALDLFYSTYGPNLAGDRDARLFLNDRGGRFDEAWPWVDPGADIQLHSMDAELADLDGDFDLDLFVSSRETVSRVYRNNRHGGTGAGAPFTDMTATALPDLGQPGEEGWSYEVEFTDMDGDGDFDLWVNNLVGDIEVALENTGADTGGFQFDLTLWIRGDAAQLEGEVDLFDYDGDGDLDVSATHVLGANFLYQSGLAQGLDPDVDGVFHKTGTSDFGSQAPWPELPATGTDGFSWDSECADMDGDGDEDILVMNNDQAVNRYLENVLGVPDTHAPGFHQVAGLPVAEGTAVHAQVRDNSAHYVIAMYDTRLYYDVDGGLETCVPMAWQGGQQFRAVIPASLDGLVSYRVESTDRAGNTGVSATAVFAQTAAGTVRWQNVGCGTPGVAGVPTLTGAGPQTPGSLNTLVLAGAAPGAVTTLFLSVTSTPVPFKGGLLHSFPILTAIAVFVDGGGQIWLPLVWPAGAPSGFPLYWQFATADGAAQGNVSLSNAVLSTSP